MKTIFSIYVWLMYGICFFLAFILGLIVFLFTFPFDPYRRRPNAVFMFFGHLMMKVNPFWRISYEGLENLDKGKRGRVVVANHQSFLDMPLLATLPFNMKWVSKRELFFVPFVGWIMWLSGHISVNRGSKKAAISLLNAVDPIKNGVDVMLFPEGTRSRAGKLKPFKKGAFHLAWQNGFQVQPIVVEGTYKVMPPDGWKMNYKGDFHVSVLEPVDPTGFDSVESLMEHVHELIRRESAKLQSENP